MTTCPICLQPFGDWKRCSHTWDDVRKHNDQQVREEEAKINRMIDERLRMHGLIGAI